MNLGRPDAAALMAGIKEDLVQLENLAAALRLRLSQLEASISADSDGRVLVEQAPAESLSVRRHVHLELEAVPDGHLEGSEE